MPPRKLAIFDVDGTLVQSYELDGECFVAAFHEALGIADVDTDWARYDHATDPGITAQIIHERQGREPSADDLVRLQSDEIVGARLAALALVDDLSGDARVGGVVVARPVGVDIGNAERFVEGRNEAFAVQLVGLHQRAVDVEDGELAGRHAPGATPPRSCGFRGCGRPGAVAIGAPRRPRGGAP